MPLSGIRRRPEGGAVVPTTTPARVAVVAADARAFDGVAGSLRAMASTGHRVVLVWLDGEPGRRLRSFKARHRLEPPAARSARGLVRRTGVLVGRGVCGADERLVRALRADDKARRLVDQAVAVVLAGPEAEQAAGLLTSPERPVVGDGELAWWKDLGATWKQLEESLGEGLENPARVAEDLLERIGLLGGSVPAAHQGLLVPLAERLHRSGDYALGLRLLEHLSTDPGQLSAADRATRRGVRAWLETSASGSGSPDLEGATAELLQAADEALEQGSVEQVVDLTTLALRLLFHRELHADELTSPLVEEPERFLASWRSSHVGALLSAPVPQRPALHRATGDSAGPEHRPRIVVSPGTFGQFAAPVVEAVSAHAEVRLLELAARPEFRWLGVSRALVDKRLRQALGEDVEPDLELLEDLEHADAAFVDWADRGALEIVMTAPAGLPVTLRIHSMDALSAWVHLIDWSRVGDLVLVSEHLRTVVVRLLGDRLSRTRVHVVANVLEEHRIPRTKTRGHRRRLLMVGWGQRVKDPLWGLEILAALRSDDPDWRLTFVGADFLRNQVTSTDRYIDEFRTRLIDDDVRDAVEFVGWTDDVGRHLADAGFILSTSRRESFGLGLVEGAASGAVPVVRDWPVFASLDGARTLFPHEWVVESVQDAVLRIRDLSEEPAWTAASRRAREAASARFGPTSSVATFRELLVPDR